jgi:3-hydroxymyristoyl/3-hydroxydecanoyl-(acyl carrier protein) dehydratase
MSVLDPVVLSERVDKLSANVLVLIPHDLKYFEGHFPGVPIVPGVVQIKWAIAMARRCLGLSGAFAGMEALKFQHVMGPDISVTLTLKYAEETGKLYFAFESDQGRYSSGRILLRSTS